MTFWRSYRPQLLRVRRRQTVRTSGRGHITVLTEASEIPEASRIRADP